MTNRTPVRTRNSPPYTRTLARWRIHCDVFMPFVSFGYADHWRPNMAWALIAEIPQPITFAPIEYKAAGEITGQTSDTDKPVPTFKITLGGVLYGFIILETVIGIVLASLLITVFTGLLRGD